MALFEDYGTPENDVGQWFPWVNDPENKRPVELQVRGIPFAKAVELEQKHGHEEFVNNSFGRRIHQRVRTDEETMQWMWDRAEWSWTGARNLSVRVKDTESADFYNRHIKPVTPYVVGSVIELDQYIDSKHEASRAVKRRLFQKSLALARFINEKSTAIQSAAEKEESDLVKNS